MVALVLHSSDPTTEIWSLRIREAKPVFVQLASLHLCSHIRAFRGDWLTFALYEDVNLPCLLNWRTGQVMKLGDKLESQGGCLAMALTDNLVVLVYRRKICVYSITLAGVSESGKLVQTLRVGFSAGYADIIAQPAGNTRQQFLLTLRQEVCICVFCICQVEGASGRKLRLDPLWMFTPGDDAYMEPCRPHIGASGTCVFWHTIPMKGLHRGAKFCVAPFSDSSLKLTQHNLPKVYELVDPGGVALYHHGIFDYDETRGIAAFGDGFGDVAVCRFFSTIGQKEVYPEIRIPVFRSEVLSEKPIKMKDLVWPFPYMSLVDPEDDTYVLNLSTDYALSHNWNTAWKGDGWGTDKNFVLEVQRKYHLYGKWKPRAESDYHVAEIFEVGGLLVVYSSLVSTAPWVANPDFTFEDLIKAPDDRNDELLSPVRLTDEYEYADAADIPVRTYYADEQLSNIDRVSHLTTKIRPSWRRVPRPAKAEDFDEYPWVNLWATSRDRLVEQSIYLSDGDSDADET